MSIAYDNYQLYSSLSFLHVRIGWANLRQESPATLDFFCFQYVLSTQENKW